MGALEKYAIWGCGKIGRLLYHIMGKELIAGYVDRDCEMGEFQGIIVQSPEEYYESELFELPLIISPLTLSDELNEELESRGKKNYLYCKEYYNFIVWLCRQLSIKKILLREKIDRVIISETDILRNLLAYNLKAEGIKEADMDGIMNDSSTKRISILNKNTESHDICLGDYFHDYRLYENTELSRFKGIHRGQRCFIVATGPSLRIEDLDVLYENNEYCIGVNGIVNAYNITNWRAQYYCISDPVGTVLWGKHIDEMTSSEIFISDAAWPYEKGTYVKDNRIFKYHLDLCLEWDKQLNEVVDISKTTFWGGTVVIDIAIPLAFYLGFKEIFLLGTDCSVPSDKHEKIKHFYKRNKETERLENVAGEMSRVFKNYEFVKQYAELQKVKIYNATRGGNLDVFERVDFDSLFRGRDL